MKWYADSLLLSYYEIQSQFVFVNILVVVLFLIKEPVSRYQDQLLSVFGSDDKLPDHILMVAIKDDFCQVSSKLILPVFLCISLLDVL